VPVPSLRAKTCRSENEARRPSKHPSWSEYPASALPRGFYSGSGQAFSAQRRARRAYVLMEGGADSLVEALFGGRARLFAAQFP
jgi:hypothetical protein